MPRFDTLLFRQAQHDGVPKTLILILSKDAARRRVCGGFSRRVTVLIAS
ncbi:MAG: hypothetical protein OEO83_04315 [Alphaproteobacteria bacterium]|nr:hypothetical protein [Alphaproteobacteria bacterium]